MKKLISIIMPIYNSEKYLQRAIESVLKQKFELFELILVNDGSTDKSYEICERYARIDSRIKVIDVSNQGVSSARNKGIHNSSGEYILFIDSDDVVEDTWCSDMYNFQMKNMDDIIVCGINRCDSELKNSKPVILDPALEFININKKDFYIIYEKWLFNSPVNKLYKREILLENKIEFNKELSLGEDLIFNLEYLKHVNKDIVVINKPLYNYIYENTESLTSRYQNNYFDIQNYLYKNIYDTMIFLNADMKKYEKLYYSRYIIDIIFALNNTFKNDNVMSFKEKLLTNKKILKSKEIKLCLKKADCKTINKVNQLIIKSKSPLLQYFYQLIRNKIKE